MELQLDQEKADDCEAFLTKVRDNKIKAATTDFLIDSIVLVMERRGKPPKALSTFLSSLLGYRGLEIHFLSLLDRIAATKHMIQLKLDFDDAITYQASKNLGISQIVSYDEDFDNLPYLERITPKQALSSEPGV